jgi:subtilisin family serine protease
MELVSLTPVMSLSSGSPSVRVGLVDGPVVSNHPDFAGASIQPVAGTVGICTHPDSNACIHGTFIAGILVAQRGSSAPSICPGCTLLVRPVFRESGNLGAPPTANPGEVAMAIVECVDAGAQVVNLSAATAEPTTQLEITLRQALDYAAGRGTVIIAAAGNQATLGSSEITRHAGVIPVVAYNRGGRPMDKSNFGASVGRRGVGAPGEAIVSLGANGPPVTQSGTSVAAAFVSGAVALLWSLFPTAHASKIRHALIQGARRRSVIPPLLNAAAAYEILSGQSR